MNHPSEPQRLWDRVYRALPRVAGVVLGVALGLRTERGLVFWLAVLLVVFSLPPNPMAWWRYVMTGARPEPTPPPAEYTEPGTWRVELHATGKHSISVIKALREVTDLSLADAKNEVDHVPSTVAAGLSEASARRVQARIERAGGTAIVVHRDV